MKRLFLLLALMLCMGCSESSGSDSGNDSGNEHCLNKQDGAECDNSSGSCICFKGEAYLNVERMCYETSDCVDEECLDKHTGDACGEGKVCECGEGRACTQTYSICLKLQPYD